jgi:hypothetical protein
MHIQHRISDALAQVLATSGHNDSIPLEYQTFRRCQEATASVAGNRRCHRKRCVSGSQQDADGRDCQEGDYVTSPVLMQRSCRCSRGIAAGRSVSRVTCRELSGQANKQATILT